MAPSRRLGANTNRAANYAGRTACSVWSCVSWKTHGQGPKLPGRPTSLSAVGMNRLRLALAGLTSLDATAEQLLHGRGPASCPTSFGESYGSSGLLMCADDPYDYHTRYGLVLGSVRTKIKGLVLLGQAPSLKTMGE